MNGSPPLPSGFSPSGSLDPMMSRARSSALTPQRRRTGNMLRRRL